MPNLDVPVPIAGQIISAKADTHIPTLQEFIALSKRNGFSRTDRFAVGFFPPGTMSTGPWDLKDLALLCEEASFPTKTLNTRTLRIHGLNEQRAHTLDYGGESISFTFIVDQSSEQRMVLFERLNFTITIFQIFKYLHLLQWEVMFHYRRLQPMDCCRQQICFRRPRHL